MRKTAFFVIIAVIVSSMLITGSAYAVGGGNGALGAVDDAVQNFENGKRKGNRLRISHPEKDAVVSGYFIPVSWRDVVVESKSLPYPDNYSESPEGYRVMLLDRNEVVLEKVVTGLNYYVFTIDEIKDVLEKKAYRFRVETLDSSFVSPPVRFVYEKPSLDDAVIEELRNLPSPPGEGAPASGEDDGQFTSLEKAYAALNASSYTTCPTCSSQYWPGMVVFYVRYPTTYAKTLYIYCGSYKYYEKTLDAGFSGPVFASMMSGYNYSAVYYDRLTLSSRCINIEPFRHTWVVFP